VGLANHAGPGGTGAFPSLATLIRYTGLSERTVRTCLDRLESEGIIRPCDPDIVAARIKRADRRPQGWDLDLSPARGWEMERSCTCTRSVPYTSSRGRGVSPPHVPRSRPSRRDWHVGDRQGDARFEMHVLGAVPGEAACVPIFTFIPAGEPWLFDGCLKTASVPGGRIFGNLV
jgi:Helix-turn-helix domain